MNTEWIISAAKEAGFIEDANCEIYGSYYHLERFAALVRAEREWVDLTDDDILMCVKSQSIIETVRRAIHAFKEKNK